MPFKHPAHPLSTLPIATIPHPGETIGRFEVRAELGRGGMAAVLLAYDNELKVDRAIKLMLPGRMTDEHKNRFRREFRTLSRMAHPNILRVYEAGTYKEQPYYVMEYLDGKPLIEVVEDFKALPPAKRFRQAERVLIEVTRALEYIHKRGLVHRDVSPSNIMIAKDGSAKLMDFGVVREPGIDLTVDGEMVGTVAYMSPEQIVSARVDARADLYSLGAVLYLMLTGRRPFNSRTLAGYLDKHLNRQVRPPRELAPTMPERLDRICVTLLEKKPESRYSSAGHLLKLLEGDKGPRPASASTSHIPLVGRAKELSQLREAVNRLASGVGSVVAIQGGTGFGKTRMADELARQAKNADLRVVRGNNSAPDQRPFLGFKDIIDALTKQVSAPDLQAAFDDATAVDRWVLLRGIRQLVAASTPVVIILDSLDLADRGTIEVAEYLARNVIGLDELPVVLAFTRELGESKGRDLEGLVSGRDTGVVPTNITLGPLSTSAVEEMLLGFVEHDDRVGSLADRLQREGAGNPYLISEMIWSLVDDGMIILGHGGAPGRLAPNAAEDVEAFPLPVPGSLRELLKERLEPLSPPARRVAMLMAASRQPLDLEFLSEVCELSPEELNLGLDELLGAGMCRNPGQGDRFELALVRLRDVVLEEAPATARQRLHRRMGEVIERRHRRALGDVVDLVSFHFERGGVPAKAYRYLKLSAERQLSRGYHKEALSLLDRAMALEPQARESMPLEDADRLLAEALLARGRSMLLLGQWQTAEDAAHEAEELAEELGRSWLLSKVLSLQSDIARLARGDTVAEPLARRALDLAKKAEDRSLEIAPLYYLGGLHWRTRDLDQARTYFKEGLRQAEHTHQERSLAQGYIGLGLLDICDRNISDGKKNLEKAFELCSGLGMVGSYVVSGVNLVEICHFTGNFRKGQALVEKVVSRAQELQYVYGMAVGLRYRALMLVDLGRLLEAEETALQALKQFQTLGETHAQFETLVVLMRIALANGDLAACEQWIAEALPLGKEADDEGYLPVVHAWRARVLLGRDDQAGAEAALQRALRLAESSWPHQQLRTWLGVARALEAMGDPARATLLAEDALRAADSDGHRYYVMRARQILHRTASDEVQRGRHQRVARALAKSLAAGLTKDDAERFLEAQS